MRNRILYFHIALFSLCGIGGSTDGSLGSDPERVVIALEYSGLTGAEGDLRYNAYWGYGSTSAVDSPFIDSLDLPEENVHILNLPGFKGAEHAAVVVEGDVSTALYFDLDADGKFTENEMIPPRDGTAREPSVEFVTPDITFTNEDGRKVPYRIMLRDYVYNQTDHNFMWSVSCVWKGDAEIHGKAIEVILFDSNFNGSFHEFGSDYIAFLDRNDEMQMQSLRSNGYVKRERLSRLIRYGDRFYRVAFSGREDAESFRLSLVEDRTPVGSLALRVKSDQKLETSLQNICYQGKGPESIEFKVSDLDVKIPEGTYRLALCYLNYQAEGGDRWSVDLSDGPEIAVRAGEKAEVAFGQPELTVTAVEEARRWDQDTGPPSEFAAGDALYISRMITGVSGEEYGRFNRLEKAEVEGAMVQRLFEEIEPKLRILDSKENVLIEKTLSYG